jgi:hypothetical protein
MGVNFQEIYSADPFASGGTQDAYRRRLLAAQLLQKKASEDDKVFSNQHGGMKLATALLGGMMEGWEEKKAKQGQAAVGRDLAGALHFSAIRAVRWLPGWCALAGGQWRGSHNDDARRIWASVR